MKVLPILWVICTVLWLIGALTNAATGNLGKAAFDGVLVILYAILTGLSYENYKNLREK